MRTRVLLLLGLPGAGKSSVGPLVAERLGWRFVDLDRSIEREAGRSIAVLFADEGESAFRARERAATVALSREKHDGLVLAPGGGWIEDSANLGALGSGVCSVYLRVSPRVALARLSASREIRPLLEVPEPRIKLEELLASREPSYLLSSHTVSVDLLTVVEVADSIVALASGSGGD